MFLLNKWKRFCLPLPWYSHSSLQNRVMFCHHVLAERFLSSTLSWCVILTPYTQRVKIPHSWAFLKPLLACYRSWAQPQVGNKTKKMVFLQPLTPGWNLHVECCVCSITTATSKLPLFSGYGAKQMDHLGPAKGDKTSFCIYNSKLKQEASFHKHLAICRLRCQHPAAQFVETKAANFILLWFHGSLFPLASILLYCKRKLVACSTVHLSIFFPYPLWQSCFLTGKTNRKNYLKEISSCITSTISHFLLEYALAWNTWSLLCLSNQVYDYVSLMNLCQHPLPAS